MSLLFQKTTFSPPKNIGHWGGAVHHIKYLIFPQHTVLIQGLFVCSKNSRKSQYGIPFQTLGPDRLAQGHTASPG